MEGLAEVVLRRIKSSGFVDFDAAMDIQKAG